MMYSRITLLAAIATTAVAKTIDINVGQVGLTFSPESITANVGDVLQFHFFNSIHTVVQGDVGTPCQMGSLQGTGFDSGATSSGEIFQVTVQNTDPIWFYCSTPGHCQAGMSGVVNPPSSGNSLATYQTNSATTSSSQSVGIVQGGVVVPGAAAPESSAPALTLSTVSSSPPKSSLVASSVPVTLQNPGSASTAPKPTSGSNLSYVSSSATLSGPTKPSIVASSRGGSLMEMAGKTALFSVVLGLVVAAVLMT